MSKAFLRLRRTGEMEIEFERSSDDLIEFALFHAAHSPSVRRQLFLEQITCALLIFFLAAGHASIFTHEVMPLPVIFGLLGGGLGYFVFPPINRSFTVHRIRSLAKEGDSSATLGHLSVALFPEGIFSITRAGESRLDWSAIKRLAQNDRYLFIYLSATSAWVIPKKAFPDDETLREFTDFIQAHRQQ
jgi:hypothetical protein